MQDNVVRNDEIVFLPRVEQCRDCGEYFLLSPGERKFYLDHQLSEPSRCKDCRSRRKAKAASGSIDKGGGSDGKH